MLSSRVAVLALFVMLSACNAASGPVTVANTSEPMTYRSLAASSIDATAAREMVSLYQPNDGSSDPALDDRQSVANDQARDMARRDDLAAHGELGSGAWALFGILFLWQLPHFLALKMVNGGPIRHQLDS